jgi:hypothetical protein
VRLAASKVIDRPPAEVFGSWPPNTSTTTPHGIQRLPHHQDLPGADGVGTTARLVRTDRGRQLHGSMEVTKYEPVSSSTEVSRFGPFSLHAGATLAPVAPASTRLELVIDTHARGAIRLLLPLMKETFGKTMARSLRIIKQHVEATPSPHDVTHLETSGTSCMPYTDQQPHDGRLRLTNCRFGCPLGTVIDRC